MNQIRSFASIGRFSQPKKVLNNIVKIRKNVTEIAKNSMNFGGRLCHEFANFGKFFA